MYQRINACFETISFHDFAKELCIQKNISKIIVGQIRIINAIFDEMLLKNYSSTIVGATSLLPLACLL